MSLFLPCTCTLQIIDDTLYEVNEEFEVVMSSPSGMARLGSVTTATVIIAGPNDGKISSLISICTILIGSFVHSTYHSELVKGLNAILGANFAHTSTEPATIIASRYF